MIWPVHKNWEYGPPDWENVEGLDLGELWADAVQVEVLFVSRQPGEATRVAPSLILHIWGGGGRRLGAKASEVRTHHGLRLSETSSLWRLGWKMIGPLYVPLSPLERLALIGRGAPC